MIHYDLRCAEGHEFDGWFRSSTAFDQQSTSGLVDCPSCGTNQVTRALMAPRLMRGSAAPAVRESANEPASPPGSGAEAAASAVQTPPAPPEKLPDMVRAVMQRLRVEVERRCDYVGQNFASEVRAMHKGDQPHRAVYGEATPTQAEQLADEGIAVSQIPWVPRADG